MGGVITPPVFLVRVRAGANHMSQREHRSASRAKRRHLTAN
jgi:hypothetical protein